MQAKQSYSQHSFFLKRKECIEQVRIQAQQVRRRCCRRRQPQEPRNNRLRYRLKLNIRKTLANGFNCKPTARRQNMNSSLSFTAEQLLQCYNWTALPREGINTFKESLRDSHLEQKHKTPTGEKEHQQACNKFSNSPSRACSDKSNDHSHLLASDCTSRGGERKYRQPDRQTDSLKDFERCQMQWSSFFFLSSFLFACGSFSNQTGIL